MHAQAKTHFNAEEIVEVVDESNLCFKIFAAREKTRREQAHRLLQQRYAWRGYSVHSQDRGGHGRITLSAASDETTVATITAGLDRGEGLYVESVYPDAVNALRASGRKLCEFTRLAVDDSVRSQSVLAAIFHVACLYVLEVHTCTDALIEVNPRHVRFYEQMLGFTQAAEQRLDPSVSAPAVLLRLDLKHCEREIERLAGRAASRRERSFYPHFFGRADADRIAGRLRLN